MDNTMSSIILVFNTCSFYECGNESHTDAAFRFGKDTFFPIRCNSIPRIFTYYSSFCIHHSTFCILHSHRLPHHAHPSLEVDLHEERAGGIGQEVDFGQGRAVGRIQEGGQLAALEVEQLDAAVAVHVAAHGGMPVRGVGVEVDFALAVLVILVDAHGVVGDEGLGRYVVKRRRQTNRKGIPMVIRREYWTMRNLSGFL